MLICEKFLIDNYAHVSCPVPHSKGLACYEYYKNNNKLIEFITFNSNFYRNNFMKYKFRIDTIQFDEAIGRNIVASQTFDVEYNDFFKVWNDIKNKLSSFKKVKIPDSKNLAEFLIWKCFFVLNDEWFSYNLHTIPFEFMNIFDENFALDSRLILKNNVINYIKENYYNFYSNWKDHVDLYDVKNFSEWFVNFFYSKEI
jgi:hypothetical protein